VAAAAAVLVVMVPVAPAAAHDVDGVGATNFRTTVGPLTPAVPGLTLRVIENGSQLELRNDTRTDVVILGYSGEPYARVGPDGALINDNSPATYLNADRFSLTLVPASASATKPPAWDKVGSQPVFRWHDHRTHWMLTELPPRVLADPGAHVHISSWSLGFTYGAQELTASGSLDWAPGPSPWPWFLLLAALVAGLAAVTHRNHPHRTIAVAVAAMVVGQIVHGMGIAQAIVGTLPMKLGAILGYDAELIWPVALVAAWLLWRGYARAIWLAAGGGGYIAVSLIVDDAPLWWRSSAPSGLPIQLNRFVLAASVGIGLGLVAAVPTMLRRHAPPSRPWAAPKPEPSVEIEDSVTQPEESTVDDEASGPVPGGIGRRQLAGYLAAGALGAVAGGTIGASLAGSSAPPASATANGALLSDVGARAVAFHGARQAGIADPVRQQARVWVAAFDMNPDAAIQDLQLLLGSWTRAAQALTAGQPLGDSDDAVVTGLGPSALTITVGFGPSLFGKAGIAASARPAALAPLPAFPGEQLDPARSDGDLGLVVAADDALLVAHAARSLSRRTNGVATLRWQMSGFNAARGAGSDSMTGRNLMGQVDGSNNPKPADPDFERRVFVPDSDPAAWLRGGSYLVFRRIRMLLDDWDRLGRPEQEQVIGRRRDNGAPLSGGTEFTPADYGAKASQGQPLIAATAHIRLATPAFNDGAAMLRRGFSYADGDDQGLLFLAWQADPRHGFIPVQRKLIGSDALHPFIQHETSALFAAPGGAAAGEYIGQRLLETQ
jgi:deferrochelatase/peroxidase EfeB